MARLNDLEVRTILLFRDLYERHRTDLPWTREAVMAELSLDEIQYDRLIRKMEDMGAVEGHGSSGIHALWFEVRPCAVQMARDIEAAKEDQANSIGPDLVDRTQAWLRSKPWVAWPTLVVLGLLGFMAAANLVIDFLRNVGLWPN